MNMAQVAQKREVIEGEEDHDGHLQKHRQTKQKGEAFDPENPT